MGWGERNCWGTKQKETDKERAQQQNLGDDDKKLGEPRRQTPETLLELGGEGEPPASIPSSG